MGRQIVISAVALERLRSTSDMNGMTALLNDQEARGSLVCGLVCDEEDDHGRQSGEDADEDELPPSKDNPLVMLKVLQKLSAIPWCTLRVRGDGELRWFLHGWPIQSSVSWDEAEG